MSDGAENVDTTVVDDAARLLRGGDLPVGETTTPTTEVPPVDDAKIHSEKSREGRQVKRLNAELAEMKRQQEEILELLRQKNQTEVQEEEDTPLGEYATPQEIEERFNKKLEKRLQSLSQKQADEANEAKRKSQEYGKKYTSLVDSELDPEGDADIYALLTDTKDTTYNKIITGDPDKDFAINLKNATRAVLAKQGATRKPTVYGKSNGVVPGVNVPTPPKGSSSVPFDRSKLSQSDRDLMSAFTDDELRGMGFIK